MDENIHIKMEEPVTVKVEEVMISDIASMEPEPLAEYKEQLTAGEEVGLMASASPSYSTVVVKQEPSLDSLAEMDIKEDPELTTVLPDGEKATSSRSRVAHAKKNVKSYSEADLQRCMDSVKRNGMTVYSVSKKYGIPVTTLRFRLSGKCKRLGRRGPQPVLTTEEDSNLVRWLQEMQQRGFPVVKQTLCYKVKNILDFVSRPNPFKNNIPGRKWISNFLDRHKEITWCTTKETSDIGGWFTKMASYLNASGQLDIVSDPSRVFSGDETYFSVHPRTRAIAVTSNKNEAYEKGLTSKYNYITVMFSFGANGSLVPLRVILPAKHDGVKVRRGLSKEWSVGKSDKGWLDFSNFLLYIRKVFHPFLRAQQVQLPIIYFIDGHSSHIAVKAADICLELGIILVALYPNPTKITPSASGTIFNPLIDAWQTIADKSNKSITIDQLGVTLQSAIDLGISESSIKNGFRVCGLYPFGTEFVEVSQFVERGLSVKVSGKPNPPPPDETVVISRETIRECLNCIGFERLRRITTQDDLTEEERIILTIYNRLLKAHDSQDSQPRACVEINNGEMAVPEENSLLHGLNGSDNREFEFVEFMVKEEPNDVSEPTSEISESLQANFKRDSSISPNSTYTSKRSRKH
ncbi:uncharacterized protein LOC129734078 [Wyeomyia smithii]|uniref:uncharacterized protein LOC129734078 n=1 Tax=Wyeomyia smithii TaxID=174621 RepID=UPI002468024C|nr:uncharacterized protein LOC129734078 [Wyeomyia smithii]XP_055551786.1 uncharacterized protein LOC129734078 [Wyeomyia smithii]